MLPEFNSIGTSGMDRDMLRAERSATGDRAQIKTKREKRQPAMAKLCDELVA